MYCMCGSVPRKEGHLVTLLQKVVPASQTADSEARLLWCYSPLQFGLDYTLWIK